MAEYFYTLDLGPIYGPKLERLAEFTSHDDFEDYAAILLCRAIDEFETWMKAELYSVFEKEIAVLREVYRLESEDHLRHLKFNRNSGDYDDGIPF
ncbi:hypothetical protein [Pseudooceanicola sp.]|uniref:hypothetical protein n=1 Tax=Pseudooceanicola sp. TaxID=1914328 RepID=UPI0040583AB6